jgi:hypothetical protein
LGGVEYWGTPFSYAIIAVVSFMQGDYASLDCLVLCYQEQRTRGFGAYEPRQGLSGGIIYCKRSLGTRDDKLIKRLPHPMKNWVRNDAEGNSECIKIPHQVRDDAER